MVPTHTEQIQVTVSHMTVGLFSMEIVGSMLRYSTYVSADKYNDATSRFDQTVSVNGAVVSTLSTGTASSSSHRTVYVLTISKQAAMAQVGEQVSWISPSI